jgi:predicted SAM-dependent methyltransferase
MIALNLGSSGSRIPEAYCGDGWEQINVDLVPPADVICDVRELKFDSESVDLVYASHILEHFYEHELFAVLREWRRVLKPGGKLIVRVPDMQAACKLAGEQGLEAIAYQSAIGPIRVLDMMFGYQQMVLQSELMAHKVAFDHPKLGRAVVKSGFAKATLMVLNEYELVCEAIK